MAFDGLVLNAVKTELEHIAVGGRIEKIYQPLRLEIVMVIHKERSKHRLLMSADARDARIHLTGDLKENPLTPPLFCMVLRKHLVGGKICDVEQVGLERVLKLKIEAVDELGILSQKHLIIEIMGKHSNILLVDPATNTILDGINRYSFAVSRHREVLPGRPYWPPPESGKLNPLEVTEDKFQTAVWDPDLEMAVERLLLERFEGFSPQTCREIVLQAGLEPGYGSQSLGELELHRLWESFSSITGTIRQGSFQPTICYRGKVPVAFSAIRLSQFPDLTCRSGETSEVIDEFFVIRGKQEQFRQAAGQLLKIVKGDIKKCQKKLAIHQNTVRKAEDAELLKIKGELITANIFRISKGTTSVQLVNYYDPEGRSLAIELEPRLTPAENAQAHFKRYSKARTGRRVAEKYLAEVQQELAYLESVALALEQAEEIGDLAEIRAELIKEGYLKPPAMRKGSRKTEPALEPQPLIINLPQGVELLVGRNNRQNDYLTMKLARPDDLWLHVKDIPGAHVIVRNTSGSEITDAVLLTAAETAAYYSRARASSKVAVDYTLRKHVRKPKGAKPGMVIYDNQKTIIAEPKTP